MSLKAHVYYKDGTMTDVMPVFEDGNFVFTIPKTSQTKCVAICYKAKDIAVITQSSCPVVGCKCGKSLIRVTPAQVKEWERRYDTDDNHVEDIAIGHQIVKASDSTVAGVF